MSPARTASQLAHLVQELLRLPTETEWVEDKHGNTNPEEIGRYISALANGAALTEHDRGYLLWGIADGTRAILGTDFEPQRAKVGNESLENWLLRHLSPQIHFTFHQATVEDKRVVVLEINRALHQPIAFEGDAYTRVGSHRKSSVSTLTSSVACGGRSCWAPSRKESPLTTLLSRMSFGCWTIPLTSAS